MFRLNAANVAQREPLGPRASRARRRDRSSVAEAPGRTTPGARGPVTFSWEIVCGPVARCRFSGVARPRPARFAGGRWLACLRGSARPVVEVCVGVLGRRVRVASRFSANSLVSGRVYPRVYPRRPAVLPTGTSGFARGEQRGSTRFRAEFTRPRPIWPPGARAGQQRVTRGLSRWPLRVVPRVPACSTAGWRVLSRCFLLVCRGSPRRLPRVFSSVFLGIFAHAAIFPKNFRKGPRPGEGEKFENLFRRIRPVRNAR